jgi:hypothetical protein
MCELVQASKRQWRLTGSQTGTALMCPGSPRLIHYAHDKGRRIVSSHAFLLDDNGYSDTHAFHMIHNATRLPALIPISESFPQT